MLIFMPFDCCIVSGSQLRVGCTLVRHFGLRAEPAVHQGEPYDDGLYGVRVTCFQKINPGYELVFIFCLCINYDQHKFCFHFC